MWNGLSTSSAGVLLIELGVSVGVGGPFLLLGRGLEGVAEALEDPPDGVVGDLEALTNQLGRQVARRLGRPPHL